MIFSLSTGSKIVSLRLYWTTQFILFGMLALHAFTYLLSPFKGVYPMLPVWSNLLVFLTIFTVTSKLSLGRAGNRGQNPALTYWVDRITSERLLFLLMGVTAIGLICHIYAKYYIVRLNPVQCVFEIRFAWLGINRDLLPAPVKLASMFGHLFSSFSYFGVFAASLNMMQAFALSKHWRKAVLFLVAFIVMGCIYAFVIASRNVMLAYVIMTLAGALLGACMQSSLKQAILRTIATLLLPTVVMMAFTAAVFSDRIFCHVKPFLADLPNVESQGSVTPDAPNAQSQGSVTIDYSKIYLQDYYKEFSIEDLKPGDFGYGWLDHIGILCPTCAPTMLYLNHGIINFSQMLATPERGPSVLFNLFRYFPEKIGLLSSNHSAGSKQRTYGPGGLPLAGAAINDYGTTGMVFVAVFMGILFGLSLRLLDAGGIGGVIGIGLFIPLFYVLMLSNIFVGINAMPFRFLAYATEFTIGVLIVSYRRSDASRSISPHRTLK